ncbi:hypothetical protein [Paenibacillus kyungheensis]
MYLTNTDGYKMIFYIENLLRDYICKHITEEEIPEKMKLEAEQNAINNGIEQPLNFRNLLDYLHLGQLYDFVKSNSFSKFKQNTSKLVTISELIRKRNNIMHSRTITLEQKEIIKETAEKFIISLQDADFKNKWDRFLQEEINNYTIPLFFVEYTLGKNFDTLVGREQELQSLKRAIKIPTPVSVIRHGGIGKTALVLQLVEDLLYSPERPFDRIYFMSFKSTSYNNGQIKKIDKSINNHNDLIYTLANYIGIENKEVNLEELENLVWNNIFSTKSLLILDNLETEIVRSNMSEFTKIADKFIQNFANPSRLLITSRYGLGDREQKFPLYELDLDRTKELIKINLHNNNHKLKNINNEDWKWVQEYSQGNPGLILTFCNTFKNTQKSLADLRIEYNSKYSSEARELHDSQDTFLEFCFDNTIDSLTKESQIFLSALCYLCDETSITEISEELITFLIDELDMGKLGIYNLRASNYVNIGFLQPVLRSDKYYVNNLFIEYLNGNFSDQEVFTVYDLKKSDWFPVINQIVSDIYDIQFDEELSLEQTLSNLYKAKYKLTSDNSYLLRSFLCDCNLKNLADYYQSASSQDILNNFSFLEKVKIPLLQNSDLINQEKICNKLIDSLHTINQLINTKKIKNFRQSNLMEYFNQLEKKLGILKSSNFNIKTRTKICYFLSSLNELDKAENYLKNHEENMKNIAFELYTKKIGSNTENKEQCNKYIDKCQIILSKDAKNLSEKAKARFYIYNARFHQDSSPKNSFKNASLIDAYEINNSILYSFYLESLLIRAHCSLRLNGLKRNTFNENALDFINKYKEEIKSSEYSKLFPKKRKSFEENLQKLERIIQKI